LIAFDNRFCQAKFNGCPDTDGDGIADKDDKCPAVPGLARYKGCPVVKEEVVKKVAASAKAIFFVSSSAKLLPESFKSLNSVATILKEDADLKLAIEGHTDNTGKAAKNQLLSEQTAKGKALNRRVVLIPKYY
jgi:outer membrane protein OmpA-like peptidoglycan-associated protein